MPGYTNTSKILETPSDKVAELAKGFIGSGKYHCGESVLLAFSEALDFPVNLNYLTGFGGGLGNTKCVCGAYNGSVVALNLLYGADKRELSFEEAVKVNAEVDQKIVEFEKRFKEKFKYTCCKLLTNKFEWGSPEHGQNCYSLTGDTAAILWDLIRDVETENAASVY